MGFGPIKLRGPTAAPRAAQLIMQGNSKMVG